MVGKLQIDCLWHQQVHTSRVTNLALSADGSIVYSGCDASAPKLHEIQESPVAALCTTDGSLLHTFRCTDPNRSYSILDIHMQANDGLACTTSSGSLLHGNALSDPHVLLEAQLPGRPAAAQALPHPPPPASTSTAIGSTQQGPTNSHTPSYIPESGYRGAKDGYVFRDDGLQGKGYYHKDAINTLVSNKPKDSGANTTLDATSQPEDARSYLQRCLNAPPRLRCALLEPHSNTLFTSTSDPDDGTILVWKKIYNSNDNTMEWQQQPSLLGHDSCVLALCSDQSGTRLVSGSYDQTIRAWDLERGQCVQVLKGHGGGIRALVVSSDGKTLYSAAADNTIRVWNLRHGVCLRTLSGRHEDTTWPCCMAVDEAAGLLITGSTGPFGTSTLKAFSTHSGECLATFAQLAADCRGDTSALVLSLDGSVLYSGASDGTVAAWKIQWMNDTTLTTSKGLRKGFI